ncbi:ABC transporter ATP-binding protein [Sutcliffiella halmapala]|uniref:ABC transporter ATP-binding protein n=1 Tax=Sutcliffiella halmapala TaxID=79882 RepID=UPI000994A439|nr:ABC transporter ATP-binding protein [Sutcliffiella halmapala]
MEISKVTFSYNQKKTHLKEVSTTIQNGKITTIIGPNGSGKSTLLNVMSNNLVPQSGEVIIDGKMIQMYSAKEFAKKLAVVHQHNEAPSDMTVEKLISYGRIPHKRIFKGKSAEDEAAIEWAITCTNLLDKRHATLDELSGGERQRVWIAMSLAQKTPILFLDEPTTYLDMYHQFEILELVKGLNQQHNVTIVMVLHDLNQAIRYSDYLLVMKQGELIMDGRPEDIIHDKSVKEIYGVNVLVKKEEASGLYVVPVGI